MAWPLSASLQRNRTKVPRALAVETGRHSVDEEQGGATGELDTDGETLACLDAEREHQRIRETGWPIMVGTKRSHIRSNVPTWGRTGSSTTRPCATISQRIEPGMEIGQACRFELASSLGIVQACAGLTGHEHLVYWQL